jgi:hypothetical protein
MHLPGYPYFLLLVMPLEIKVTYVSGSTAPPQAIFRGKTRLYSGDLFSIVQTIDFLQECVPKSINPCCYML